MGDRYWLWLGARLLVGVAIVAAAASYLSPGSGEKEFQTTLDAMKQVRTFRAVAAANPGTQRNEWLWEVDCNRDLLHYQMHVADVNPDHPAQMNFEEMHVGNTEFLRQKDGSWAPNRYGSGGQSAKWLCGNLAQGTDSNLLPQIATMVKRGILQKGDKKTVNGVRCREWLVTMRGAPSGLEHDTVCLGLEDHLPYELTVDWEHARTSFSDYNAPIQMEVPTVTPQPAASTATDSE